MSITRITEIYSDSEIAELFRNYLGLNYIKPAKERVKRDWIEILTGTPSTSRKGYSILSEGVLVHNNNPEVRLHENAHIYIHSLNPWIKLLNKNPLFKDFFRIFLSEVNPQKLDVENLLAKYSFDDIYNLIGSFNGSDAIHEGLADIISLELLLRQGIGADSRCSKLLLWSNERLPINVGDVYSARDLYNIYMSKLINLLKSGNVDSLVWLRQFYQSRQYYFVMSTLGFYLYKFVMNELMAHYGLDFASALSKCIQNTPSILELSELNLFLGRLVTNDPALVNARR